MDRFVVFFEAVRPISHFGWNGAFCGAEPTGPPRANHGWTGSDVHLCPLCVRVLPQGRRHLFASETAPTAACGSARDFTTVLSRGIDLTDPDLCDRCVARGLVTYRIGWVGALINLWRPVVFNPTRALAIP